jgi:hypothetical protein
MSLPPALTWLYLFPSGTACAVAPSPTVPEWFGQMLRGHAGERGDMARPRAVVAWGRAWHELADLPKWHGLVAVNCPGVTAKRLEASGFAYARRFAVLPSLANARWFVPLDSGAVASSAFSIYTPARASAHLKKAAVKLAARVRAPLWYRDSVVVASRAVPPLEQAIGGVFPGRTIRLGISAGAPEPAINRKPSAVVLGERGQVLGFVKVAASEVSERIVRHEADMLPALSGRGQLAGVTPKLLFAGDVDR